MWTRTDSWQQNQSKRFTLGIASKKQCNQEMRELMGSVLSHPSTNMPPAAKGSPSPEPGAAVHSCRFYWAQGTWRSRNMSFIDLILSPETLRSSKLATLYPRGSYGIRKEQLCCFMCYRMLWATYSIYLMTDKFACALWLLKMNCLLWTHEGSRNSIF